MISPPWYTTLKECRGLRWAESEQRLREELPHMELTITKQTAASFDGMDGFFFDYNAVERK